jgi:hypothetical protein
MAKGKWAEGIRPRHFCWVLKDRLAISERLGGYGDSHRKVRRTEEIIWVREQNFHTVFSLIGAPHNLHNYDEMGVRWEHRPFPHHDELPEYQLQMYQDIHLHLYQRHRILFHQEEVNGRMIGLIGGYVVWAGLIHETPKAIAIVESIVGRQMGPRGRELVTIAQRLPRPPADMQLAARAAEADSD